MQKKATFTELSSYQLICMAFYKTRVWSLCQAIQGSPLTFYRVFVVVEKAVLYKPRVINTPFTFILTTRTPV